MSAAPPSTFRICPVMQFASGEQSSDTAAPPLDRACRQSYVSCASQRFGIRIDHNNADLAMHVNLSPRGAGNFTIGGIA